MKVKKYEEAAALAASTGLRNSCKLHLGLNYIIWIILSPYLLNLKKLPEEESPNYYYLSWKDNEQLRKYYENGHKQIYKLVLLTLDSSVMPQQVMYLGCPLALPNHV